MSDINASIDQLNKQRLKNLTKGISNPLLPKVHQYAGAFAAQKDYPLSEANVKEWLQNNHEDDSSDEMCKQVFAQCGKLSKAIDDLEKGRGKPIGTISTHAGKQVIKTADGWKPHTDGKSKGGNKLTAFIKKHGKNGKLPLNTKILEVIDQHKKETGKKVSIGAVIDAIKTSIQAHPKKNFFRGKNKMDESMYSENPNSSWNRSMDELRDSMKNGSSDFEEMKAALNNTRHFHSNVSDAAFRLEKVKAWIDPDINEAALDFINSALNTAQWENAEKLILRAEKSLKPQESKKKSPAKKEMQVFTQAEYDEKYGKKEDMGAELDDFLDSLPEKEEASDKEMDEVVADENAKLYDIHGFADVDEMHDNHFASEMTNEDHVALVADLIDHGDGSKSSGARLLFDIGVPTAMIAKGLGMHYSHAYGTIKKYKTSEKYGKKLEALRERKGTTGK